MVRALLGALVIAHGLVTGLIWVTPETGDAPFDASHSWLLGDSRSAAIVGGLAVGAGFVVTGPVFSPGRNGGRWWAWSPERLGRSS